LLFFQDNPSSDKEDSEMNIHSLNYVTPLTVEPEINFQFIKSELVNIKTIFLIN